MNLKKLTQSKAAERIHALEEVKGGTLTQIIKEEGSRCGVKCGANCGTKEGMDGKLFESQLEFA